MIQALIKLMPKSLFFCYLKTIKFYSTTSKPKGVLPNRYSKAQTGNFGVLPTNYISTGSTMIQSGVLPKVLHSSWYFVNKKMLLSSSIFKSNKVFESKDYKWII